MPTMGVAPPGVCATGVSSHLDRTFFSPTTGVVPPKLVLRPRLVSLRGPASHSSD